MTPGSRPRTVFAASAPVLVILLAIANLVVGGVHTRPSAPIQHGRVVHVCPSPNQSSVVNADCAAEEDCAPSVDLPYWPYTASWQ